MLHDVLSVYVLLCSPLFAVLSTMLKKRCKSWLCNLHKISDVYYYPYYYYYYYYYDLTCPGWQRCAGSVDSRTTHTGCTRT